MPEPPSYRNLGGAERAPFRAVTLRPDNGEIPRPLVQRTRILEMINRPPVIGPITCITGPLGSGKTVLAMQWALNHGGPIHYVSARQSNDVPSEWIEEPDEIGLAIAALLNSCSRSVSNPSSDQIRANLERVVTLTEDSTQSIILDNLELLSLDALSILEGLLKPALQNLKTERLIIISRIMNTHSLGYFQGIRGFRLVLPSTMEFDVKETTEAHQLGVFGSVPLDQVLEAREESGGWITGMHITLEKDDERLTEFRDYILNDMILEVISPILHLMIAAAHVPWNNNELWEKWFDHLELPHWAISSTQSQLPTRISDRKTHTFEVIPVMRDVLIRLGTITAQQDIVDRLLGIAMDWYVSQHEISSAIELATKRGLERLLLAAIKPMCVNYAQEEDWTSIVELIDGFPDEVLVQDVDLTFWAFHGLVDRNRSEKMNRLYGLVASDWEHSEDQLVKGRFHLIRAWTSYMLSRCEESREEAQRAYDILPTNAYRERLWAAGSVSIAESFLADSPQSHQWATTANYYLPYLPTNLRWWHNGPSPIRLSYLATSGKMMQAYDVASAQIDALEDNHPNLATRYYLIKAMIDIERLRFEAAEKMIGCAENLAIDSYAQPTHLRLVQAALARARGDLEGAWEILFEDNAHPIPRHDLKNRVTGAVARIALDMGDISTAQFTLASITQLYDPWPNYFLDTHPNLTLALLHCSEGRYTEAASLARSVADEGRRRGHTYFATSAYATLVYILLQAGETGRASRAMRSALTIGGDSGYQLAYYVLGQDIRLIESISGFVNAPETESQESSPEAPTELTSREIEALSLAAQAFSNKEIAEQMYISVSTVKNHLSRAFDKLGTNNRRSAIRIAKNIGLLDK